MIGSMKTFDRFFFLDLDLDLLHLPSFSFLFFIFPSKRGESAFFFLKITYETPETIK